MKYKRVVVISSFVHPSNHSPVGVNKKLLSLCSELFQEVVFITSNYPGAVLKELPVKLINIPMSWHRHGGINTVKFAAMQLKLIPVLKPYLDQDTLLMFWLSGPMIIPFTYAMHRHVKNISFIYGNSRLKSEKQSRYNNLIAKLTAYMGKHADHLGIESKSVINQWDEGFDPAKVSEIYLHSDTARFCPSVPYESRDPIVGMSCRLAANKKVMESIEAFNSLRDRLPEWKMEIVGSGLLEDSCRALIETLEAQDRIRLVGWVDYHEMHRYYNRFKLLLFPTSYEGLPNALIEAMCCRTPALASPAGGIPDVVEDGVTGWILRDMQVQTIADQLVRIIEGGNMEWVSGKAAEFARKKYSYTEALKNFSQAITKIMEQ